MGMPSQVTSTWSPLRPLTDRLAALQFVQTWFTRNPVPVFSFWTVPCGAWPPCASSGVLAPVWLSASDDEPSAPALFFALDLATKGFVGGGVAAPSSALELGEASAGGVGGSAAAR